MRSRFVAGLTVSTLLLAAESTAAEPNRNLVSIGLDFEAARALPPAEKAAQIESIDGALRTLLDADLSDEERASAHFLWAEVQREGGRYDRALELYEKALKSSEKEYFSDDVAFSRIVVLEAQGREEDAAKSWEQWLGQYPNSPLRADAWLGQAWSAMRRGNLGLASSSLESIDAHCAWMTSQSRYLVARATLALHRAQYDRAIEYAESGQGAVSAYVSALAHAAQGNTLKAAARFQEVAERYADSPLRDHAMLAKANTFLQSGAYRSAAEEYRRVAERAQLTSVRSEAALREGACIFLDGDPDGATQNLRQVLSQYAGTDVAARAQFLLGETMLSRERYDEAILEFNRVLTSYFQHSVAASAQYRVARCFDALGRRADATSAYEAVVSGYPLEPEAPAAAYLAGVGLLELGRPLAAAPYFQLVIDRYALEGENQMVVFASEAHHELVEASLCLLEFSYHQAGDLGQLSGAPHLMLQRMPPSQSPWRAYALLIDADAQAAQGRYDSAQANLNALLAGFPNHPAAAPANQLLAWTHAQQGNEQLAIETEQRMLEQYARDGNEAQLASAYLNMAHVRFNEQRYEDAATAYENYLARFPVSEQRSQALYQAGLCYLRLGRTGDAVDRWEDILNSDPASPIAEKAFARAGDLYFQSEHYDDAKRCYQGLLQNFQSSSAAAIASLRLAQCDYNAGHNADALAGFAGLLEKFPHSPIVGDAERGLELALFQLGQEPEGHEVLRQLVNEHPNSSFAADAQFQIAQRLYEEERFLEAAEEFRRVVSQFPSYSAADRAQYLMADAYRQGLEESQAQGALEQFLMFFPDSELRTTVQFQLGMIYFENEDYVRTAVAFTSVLEQEDSPELRAAALFNLALCKRMIGQLAEAQADFEQYRREHPGDERAIDVAYQLGDLHQGMQNWAPAIEEFAAALAAGASAEQVVELQFRTGVCHEQMGDREAALAAFARARKSSDKSNPFRISAVARSAALYEEAEQWKDALEAYRDLIKHSNDPDLVAAANDRAAQLESVVGSTSR